MDEYRATNLSNWESRVPVHTGPSGYAIAELAADRTRLSKVVTFDAPYLGDLSGLDVVHVQCHIGTDTISLARLGGRITGVDFSPSALAAAAQLARDGGVPDARFVQSELYNIPNVLGAEFDLVYTGVGALNWLPDIRGWARVVAGLLRPGGRLYLREAHPVLWAVDDERPDDLFVLALPYFEHTTPNRWDTPMSYEGDEPIAQPITFEWNHGLGEIVQAVLDAGLQLTALREHDFCEWKALPWLVETADRRFVMPEGRERVPLMQTLEARKPLS
jgi:SAM-dependent methyltransferase